jgi:DoxX-like protein
MAVRQIGDERVFAEHRGLLPAVTHRVLGGAPPSRYVESCTWLAPSSFFPDGGPPALGIAAAAGLVLYFTGALVAHLRVHDRQSRASLLED